MGTLVGEMRRAGATSIQELKFLISFAIVVRELLCPALLLISQRPKNFRDPSNEDEHDDSSFFAGEVRFKEKIR